MKKQNKTKIIELTVKGMTCRHCAEKVKSAITKVKGVEYTEVDYQKGFASVVAESAQTNLKSFFQSPMLVTLLK